MKYNEQVNKYIVSKIGIAVFSVTTVILFVLSREGLLFQLAGSIALGVIIYLVNSACLVFFAIMYIWQRAQKGRSSFTDYEALNMYATAQSESQSNNSLQRIRCSLDTLKEVMASKDEQIIDVLDDISTLQLGDEVLLYEETDWRITVRAKVLAIEDATLRVFVKNEG